MTSSPPQIPVIDLFAGPGGLGEGFASLELPDGSHPFRLAISIEMEQWAHSTLRFRAFMRALEKPLSVDDWMLAAGSHAGLDQLMDRHPLARRAAEKEALRRRLGQDDPAEIRHLISKAIGAASDSVLIGGPPCQAYSLVGRARNRGIAGYVAEEDHRQTLYLEYLQILADHEPAVFVMENVKGLMSASLNSQHLFELIRSDLQQPAKALAREGKQSHGSGSEYHLHPLTVAHELFPRSTDFVLRAECFGVPQARHRIILLGIRDDINVLPEPLAKAAGATVGRVIEDLPRLRSSVSNGDMSAAAWKLAVTGIQKRPWMKDVEPAVRRMIRKRLKQVTAIRAGTGSNCMERTAAPPSDLPWLGSEIPDVVLNHQARSHMASDLERYFFAACWGEVHERSPSLGGYPEGLLPAHRNVGRALSGELFSDRFRVQLAKRCATTITSHIAKDGHYFIHPDPTQCRSLTVREAARLQTFPEDYLFSGPRTSQYQQVGNAVPPHLALQIASSVAGVLRS